MTTTGAWGSGTTPQPLLIQCQTCDAPSLGTERGTSDLVPGPDDEFDPTRYILVSCDKCQAPQLLVQFSGHYDWEEPKRAWPLDPSEPLSQSIPKPIQREMSEARACFKAKLYTATAVMVRRTLEGMCFDQGTTKKALFQSLQELSEAGKIEGRLLEWAQALRVLGNQGAHFSKDSVGREDAQDALSLAEALLDYVYVFTARYEEFQKRRQPPAGGTA
ncbi:DUF4145 domain-containing protein [Actinacidiphila glaucinigra]|uniref:DUF4145 domain-containing protein n=1 Tax=Actinacidiphila glaucinigra TaxID=235986 RepID=UPI003865D827